MSYAINPLAHFPKRWKDKDGNSFRVMSEPVEGYLMCRYPGAMPFVMHVSDILGSARRPHPHGPFTPISRRKGEA